MFEKPGLERIPEGNGDADENRLEDSVTGR